MKRKLRSAVSVALAAVLMLLLAPAETRADAAYTAPYSTVRIGLYTFKDDGNIDQRSFPSANLQNVAGLGWGYEFGYFDENRQFVPLGISVTDTDQITMMMDRNMVYDANSNSYSEGSSGSVVVGCFHERLGTYADVASAQAAIAGMEDAFIRYENGQFVAMRGAYTGAVGNATDSGSTYTVTVVRSRTNQILFEFDCGTQYSLAVRPLSQNGEKPQTWFRKYTYYGAFAYLRNTGANLTVVNYVDVEDYVKGVVCWEMSPSWPLEALKAQAVTARTYLMVNIRKHNSSGFDICNTTDCQAYHGTSRASENSDAAVDATAGEYLTYQGALCETSYSSSDGGATENSENVWTQRLEYCRGVVDPYEQNVAATVDQYYWTRSYTAAELGQRVANRGYNFGKVKKVDMVYTAVGNVYSITFTDVNGKKVTLSKTDAKSVISGRSQRFALGTYPQVPESAGGGQIFVNGQPVGSSLSGLYAIGSGGLDTLGGTVYAITGKGSVAQVDSTAMPTASAGPDANGKFVFYGSGWGHNVGMSQWGAYSMAKYYDKTYIDILTFYYTGTEIVRG